MPGSRLRRRTILAAAGAVVTVALSLPAAMAVPDGGPAPYRPEGAAPDSSGFPCYSHPGRLSSGLHYPIPLCQPVRALPS